MVLNLGIEESPSDEPKRKKFKKNENINNNNIDNDENARDVVKQKNKNIKKVKKCGTNEKTMHTSRDTMVVNNEIEEFCPNELLHPALRRG